MHAEYRVLCSESPWKLNQTRMSYCFRYLSAKGASEIPLTASFSLPRPASLCGNEVSLRWTDSMGGGQFPCRASIVLLGVRHSAGSNSGTSCIRRSSPKGLAFIAV